MNNPFAPSPTSPPSPQTATGAPRSPPPDDSSHPLRQLTKFNEEHNIRKKTASLRCVVCSKKTSWYCVTCTDGPHARVPVCPSITRGCKAGGRGGCQHACEGFHCKHPTFKKGGKRKNTKRRRLDPDDPILEGDSDEDDRSGTDGD